MTTLSNTYTASHAATHRAITILGAGHIGFAMALLLQQPATTTSWWWTATRRAWPRSLR